MDAIDPDALARAEISLQGLSVGDAFGNCFFQHPDRLEAAIDRQILPAPMWTYTDDTEMALSLFAMLRSTGTIDRDALARSFAIHYDSTRGYGPSMHRILTGIRAGEDWRDVTRAAFSGQGSWGNGAAMRAGIVGAYFAKRIELAIEYAEQSAQVTHAHPEAIAGAIAVAVAAARAGNIRAHGWQLNGRDFLDLVVPYVPPSEVASKIRRARDFPDGTSVQFATAVLGNGTKLSAPDTVPFALWCAANSLDRFADALWLTVSGGGDRDTTCAIVGSIVSLTAAIAPMPAGWLAAREPLPIWAFGDESDR
jgi:ADP-ribosylglycohydrolase